VRADRRLATTGAQNHDPDTSPCEWQTCFLLPKYLLRVRRTSVSGVRTAQCVAELLLNAQRCLRYTISRQDVAASKFQQLGEDFSVVRSIHWITRQGGTKTRFEARKKLPGRQGRQ